MTKPLHFEPRESSPLDFYAAAHAGLASGDLPDPYAPKVPRDSGEPAHLHVVLALLVFVGVCVTLLAASMLHGLGWLVGVVAQYADSLLPAVVRWIGGVL